MVKNNIKSIICLIVATILFRSFIANKIEKLSMIEILIIGLAFISIYCLFGFFFLENKGSFNKNFKSVMILCIVGLAIWSVCFYKTDYELLSNGFMSDRFTTEWWMNHDFIWNYFNIYLIPFNFINIIFQFIIFSGSYNAGSPRIMDIVNIYNIFIPSLLLCSGIKLRIKLNQFKSRSL